MINSSINSQKIEQNYFLKNFTNLYETFFLEYPLILSCNVSIPLLPPITNIVGGFGLIQKLPSKIYLGIKIVPGSTITINKIYIYNTHEKSFVERKFNDITNKDILPYVKNFLEKNNFHKGLEIGIIYEKGIGFGTFANTISLLTIGLFLLTEKISHQTSIIERKPQKKYLQETAKTIYGTGMVNIKHQSPYNIEASLLASKEPLILFPQQAKNTKESSIQPISKFFNQKKATELELDILILNFGIEYSFDETKKKFNHYLTYTNKKIKDIMQKLLKHNPALHIPDSDELEKAFHTIIMAEKIKTLKYFGDIISNPEDYHHIENLIETYNDRYAFAMLTEKQSEIIEIITTLFNQHKAYPEERIGITPFTSAQIGGSIMIVAPAKRSRTTLIKTLEAFKTIYNYPFSLEYVSREEGFGGEEAQVEQNLYNQFSSPMFQQELIVAYTLQGEEAVGKHEELLKTYAKSMIMDMVNKKIYIKGKKVSSEEIFSQHFTLQLFDILLRNIDENVPNSELEISSYSKYKNQLVGKIIIPLQKIAEKHFGQKLDITCKGSNHDFSIMLKKSSFPLVIIKKLR